MREIFDWKEYENVYSEFIRRNGVGCRWSYVCWLVASRVIRQRLQLPRLIRKSPSLVIRMTAGGARSMACRRQFAQCDSKLVGDFKAKGDWCEKHNRPDSQCFVCHPEKEAEFAALYEAKYGEQPPKPEADGQPEKSDKT